MLFLQPHAFSIISIDSIDYYNHMLLYQAWTKPGAGMEHLVEQLSTLTKSLS